jgi:hypothetical protein
MGVRWASSSARQQGRAMLATLSDLISRPNELGLSLGPRVLSSYD